MPLIIPVGYAQVITPLLHSASTREATITYGIAISSGATASNTMANALNDALDSSLGSNFASEVTIGPTVLVVGQDGGENLIVEGTTTQQGSSPSDKVPSNCAGLIKKTTSRGGRRGRGRMYFPWFISEGEVAENGQIGSTYVTAINGALATWLAAVLGTTDVDEMYLLHSTGASSPGSPNAVTGLTLDPLIATQRRRLGR